ncbi:MAG: hypothetical protein JSV99_12400 [Planctomycetota bacterium]|nr:MAG: hypothetical protein JSV99_12400 [Planctomycetota bacterium]
MVKRKFSRMTFSAGSALILAVVLTSLLAIVGTIFLMAARVDKIATSAISENKELNFAVEAVLAKILRELALDVPGARKGGEYYDYPDVNDRWLASLEPYKDGEYKWRQISDVTGFLEDNNFDVEDVSIEPPYAGKYINDYPVIKLDSRGDLEERWADADGDGIADSKWIELDGTTSGKGKPIYAAIRVIDNGGMINVNTARDFDATASQERIDGSSQTQIDLLALAERGSTANPLDRLDTMRYGSEPKVLDDYIKDVVWRYDSPDGDYTPFDISDELELRNRFVLDVEHIVTRIEDADRLWKDAFTGSYYVHVPVGSGEATLDGWFNKAHFVVSELDADKHYSYRHISTKYNMDRIIDPNGAKMLNINDANVSDVYRTVRRVLADPNFVDVNGVSAQVAVNLIDYRDDDSNVTVFDAPPAGGKRYYGFESPCIYISELVHKFKKLTPPGGPIGPGGVVEPVIYRSYAIELYKPYPEDKAPIEDDWKLVIGETPGGPIGAPPYGAKEYYIEWSGTEDFHVILFQDPEAELNVDPAASVQEPPFARYGEIFEGGDLIELQRRVRASDGSDIWVTVDSNLVPDVNANGSPWLNPEAGSVSRSVRRDITPHKCIRRLWSAPLSGSTLGDDNNHEDPNTDVIQAHPADKKFTNVGEIGMVFRKGAYYRKGGNRAGAIGYSSDKDQEDEVRLDLADPNFQQIFRYLTRLDPTRDGIDNDGDGETDESELDKTPEFKVPGRININTAPWYVMAQLPWVSQRGGGYNNVALAQAIVAYRDKLGTPVGYSARTGKPGFKSIGELNGVVDGSDDYRIDYYAGDSSDLTGFPDLTTPDHPHPSLGGAADDFEERDVIFARISDLVTVRSDVFTAYILVRIGTDGPQKRVIAVLDRSNVYSTGGKVRVAALHPVPDPR